MLQSHILGLLADLPPLNGGFTFYDLVQTAYAADPFSLEILQMLGNGIW
jgi:hypothetical protein